MTPAQTKYLKALGYEDTDEEDAVLKHKDFPFAERFVWRWMSFTHVLMNHNRNLETGLRSRLASNIARG